MFDGGRIIDIHRGPASTARVLLRGDGADPLIDALPAGALGNHLKLGLVGPLLKDFFWLTWARGQVPRFGIRTLLRKSLGRAAPPASVGPYPEWLNADLERRLGLRERWRAESEAVDLRPGLELEHAYWPQQFETYDLGGMELAAEMRYPFLDTRLARFLLRLPPIPWAVEKSLLRVALKHALPASILRRPKSPVAGNPWAMMLPGAETRWWEDYLVPNQHLAHFVNIEAANSALARVVKDLTSRNDHKDIGLLRISVRPVDLVRWLRRGGPAP